MQCKELNKLFNNLRLSYSAHLQLALTRAAACQPRHIGDLKHRQTNLSTVNFLLTFFFFNPNFLLIFQPEGPRPSCGLSRGRRRQTWVPRGGWGRKNGCTSHLRLLSPSAPVAKQRRAPAGTRCLPGCRGARLPSLGPCKGESEK